MFQEVGGPSLPVLERFNFEKGRTRGGDTAQPSPKWAEKPRWGGMGAWGEGLREGPSFGKAGSSRAGSDRMAAQAVPVATKEATGIDSRDEGFPFPPNNLRIVFTGSKTL